MTESKQFRLSTHAHHAVSERGIRLEWIEDTLNQPKRVEGDSLDPALRHALATIDAFGDRVLRVIYNPTREPWVVVTAYFDRSMKGRL